MKKLLSPVVISALFILASCNQSPYKRVGGEDVYRIATYNVGVFAKYDESSISATAALMTELQPDVLVMNEVDSCTSRTGNVHQLEAFVSEMPEGWEGQYAPALKPYKGGAYGVAEAWNSNRMKEVGGFNVLLPKGDGSEYRALVVKEYENMVVAGTHLEVRSENMRFVQLGIITDTLTTLYGASGKPVFLCGDFNAYPDSKVIEMAKQNWDLLSVEKTTYPKGDKWEGLGSVPERVDDTPGICIDYIFILKNGVKYELLGSDVGVGFNAGTALTASDHLPVFVDVRF
jgi:endonuclease/exonuclease/phosphatase family metal-dependent hydrolase